MPKLKTFRVTFPTPSNVHVVEARDRSHALKVAAEQYDAQEDCFDWKSMDDVEELKKGWNTVTIEIGGGVLQDVKNLPPGWNYKLIDHDDSPLSSYR